MFPDPKTDQQKLDVAESIRAFHHNFPMLVAELGRGSPYSHVDGEETFGLNARGPILNSAMLHFAARLGFALHEQTTGRMVGNKGAAFVKWYSNAQAFEGRLPQDLFRVLGPNLTLRQGRLHVGDQFAYSVAHPHDHSVYGYWASFRAAFAVLAFVSDADASSLDAAPLEGLFKPGFLRGYSVTALPWGRWPWTVWRGVH